MNKALLTSIPPVTLLVLQLAPSALLLWISVLISRVRAPDMSLVAPLALLGILNPGIAYTMSLVGLERISASVATLLWGAEPLMILGLAAMILREPMTWRLFLVMLAGFCGVLLVADFGASFGSTGNDAIGILLLLAAVLCCAIYTVFSRMLGERVDPVFTVAAQQTAGLVWALAFLGTGTRFGEAHDIGTIPTGLLAAATLSGCFTMQRPIGFTSQRCAAFQLLWRAVTSTSSLCLAWAWPACSLAKPSALANGSEQWRSSCQCSNWSG